MARAHWRYWQASRRTAWCCTSTRLVSACPPPLFTVVDSAAQLWHSIARDALAVHAAIAPSLVLTLQDVEVSKPAQSKLALGLIAGRQTSHLANFP